MLLRLRRSMLLRVLRVLWVLRVLRLAAVRRVRVALRRRRGRGAVRLLELHRRQRLGHRV